jgi:hypothetical protein
MGGREFISPSCFEKRAAKKDLSHPFEMTAMLHFFSFFISLERKL